MEDKYLIPIAVLVAAILVAGALVYSKISPGQQQAKITPDQNTDNTQNTDQNSNQGTQPTPVLASGIPGVSSFNVKDDKQICKEDGKPVVYLFSTTVCPHCIWVKPIFDKVVKEYISQGKIVAYHWEYNTQDNALTDAVETSIPQDQQTIYEEFSPGGYVPTFIFGCKYYRVGNGPSREQSNDIAAEEKELRALLDYLISQ